jgi:hypothetical protein
MFERRECAVTGTMMQNRKNLCKNLLWHMDKNQITFSKDT